MTPATSKRHRRMSASSCGAGCLDVRRGKSGVRALFWTGATTALLEELLAQSAARHYLNPTRARSRGMPNQLAQNLALPFNSRASDARLPGVREDGKRIRCPAILERVPDGSSSSMAVHIRLERAAYCSPSPIPVHNPSTRGPEHRGICADPAPRCFPNDA